MGQFVGAVIAVTAKAVRFLHLADVHLGFDRYDSPERSKDFFLAFRDVLQRYALEPGVDFVLIAGDLFEHNSILPHVLNQAESALGMVRQAQIPVFVIEGNHDNRPYGVNTSWLRYLADHEFLILLEPTSTDQGPVLEPWHGSRRRGGYIDLDCGVRVVGSSWYGSAAPRAIQDLAGAIQALPAGPQRTILLFHHGLEGQVARYSGALRYGELAPLRQAGVDYLALGHIHKSYTVDNWLFNPGSLEANSIAEAEFERGAFTVELDPDSGQIQVQLVTEYYQRSCRRLRVEAKGKETPEQIQEWVVERVRQAAIDPEERPILEVKILGQIGFSRQELDHRALQRQIQETTGALVVLLRLEASSVEFDSPVVSDPEERLQIEEQVYTDLLAGHAHYRKRSQELARVLLGLKEMVLDELPEPETYGQLGQAVLGNGFAEED